MQEMDELKFDVTPYAFSCSRKFEFFFKRKRFLYSLNKLNNVGNVNSLSFPEIFWNKI